MALRFIFILFIAATSVASVSNKPLKGVWCDVLLINIHPPAWESVEDLEAITPSILRDERFDARAHRQLPEEVLQSLIAYASIPEIAETPFLMEKAMLRHFGESRLVGFSENIMRVLAILDAYDQNHGTSFAAHLGLSILQRLKPEPENSFTPGNGKGGIAFSALNSIRYALESSQISPAHEALGREFFNALLTSPSLEKFLGYNIHINLITHRILPALQKLPQRARPPASQVRRFFVLYLAHLLQKASTYELIGVPPDDPIEVGELVRAVEIAYETSKKIAEYFEAIGEPGDDFKAQAHRFDQLLWSYRRQQRRLPFKGP